MYIFSHLNSSTTHLSRTQTYKAWCEPFDIVYKQKRKRDWHYTIKTDIIYSHGDYSIEEVAQYSTIPIVEIRRSCDRLIPTMIFPILVTQHTNMEQSLIITRLNVKQGYMRKSDQILIMIKTHFACPSPASYEVPCVRIVDKIDSLHAWPNIKIMFIIQLSLFMAAVWSLLNDIDEHKGHRP